jgi:glutathione-independent formaldehyde dehydrogenase
MLPVAAVKIVKRFDRYLFKCNGDRAGGAYGYVDMGGWIGGQAEYDGALCRFQPIEIPDKEQAMDIRSNC